MAVQMFVQEGSEGRPRQEEVGSGPYEAAETPKKGRGRTNGKAPTPASRIMSGSASAHTHRIREVTFRRRISCGHPRGGQSHSRTQVRGTACQGSSQAALHLSQTRRQTLGSAPQLRCRSHERGYQTHRQRDGGFAMNLTPASLKTLRRKGFKKAMKYLSQSSSPLCVFASLRETSSALAPSRQKAIFYQ